MSIPTVIGELGLLPPGRHKCSLDEIEEHFVRDAPFPVERRLIFDAFSVWARAVGNLLPGARCWVDGGFVTHKQWAPPQDVDVVVFATVAELDGLSDKQQQQLQSLLTEHGPGVARSQPMGGLVDGFVGLRSDPERTIYWNDQWSRVRGSDGGQVEAAHKGFLEVTL